MTTAFRLYLLTWNVGETNPPKDLTKLLGLNGKTLPNLYAVGLQEMKSTTASRVSDLVFEDAWTTALTDCLSTQNYVRIKMRRLMGIHISVYVKRADLPYITNVESECTKTGLGGFWGNKGALSIRLNAFGVNICIVNAHFTAHQENFRGRLEDYNVALETQRFRDKETETILDHDYVFWMGDLNFRIDGITNQEVRRRAKEKDFDYLSKYDQLSKAVKEELIFLDFVEGPLTFPPTFKFDVGTDVYDTSAKNRVPSYCDRVLWRVHEDSYEGVDLSVDQLSYGCMMDEKSSDHKPVFSEFVIQVLKTPPELPVMFEPMNNWCQHKDNNVSYLVLSSLEPNSRDWIGLYREGYKNWLDYVTYVWASGKGEDAGMHDGSQMHTVTFESRYLQRLPPDNYYLLYFSFIKNCVVGYSDSFRILVTEESSTSSSEDEGETSNTRQGATADEADGLMENNFHLENKSEQSEELETKCINEDEELSEKEEEDEDEDRSNVRRNEDKCKLIEYVEPDRERLQKREEVRLEAGSSGSDKKETLSSLVKVKESPSSRVEVEDSEVTDKQRSELKQTATLVHEAQQVTQFDVTKQSDLMEVEQPLPQEAEKTELKEEAWHESELKGKTELKEEARHESELKGKTELKEEARHDGELKDSCQVVLKEAGQPALNDTGKSVLNDVEQPVPTDVEQYVSKEVLDGVEQLLLNVERPVLTDVKQNVIEPALKETEQPVLKVEQPVPQSVSQCETAVEQHVLEHVEQQVQQPVSHCETVVEQHVSKNVLEHVEQQVPTEVEQPVISPVQKEVRQLAMEANSQPQKELEHTPLFKESGGQLSEVELPLSDVAQVKETDQLEDSKARRPQPEELTVSEGCTEKQPLPISETRPPVHQFETQPLGKEPQQILFQEAERQTLNQINVQNEPDQTLHGSQDKLANAVLHAVCEETRKDSEVPLVKEELQEPCQGSLKSVEHLVFENKPQELPLSCSASTEMQHEMAQGSPAAADSPVKINRPQESHSTVTECHVTEKEQHKQNVFEQNQPEQLPTSTSSDLVDTKTDGLPIV